MRVLNVSQSGWWSLHADHTIKFVEDMRVGDREDANREVVHLVQMLPRWEEIVATASRRPHVGAQAVALMAEHLVGVKMAVEGATEGRPDDVKVAVAMLKRNAVDQAEIYGAAVPGFAEDEFLDLFGRHVDLAAEYIGALAADDDAGFVAATDAARRNAEELDAFTDRDLHRR